MSSSSRCACCKPRGCLTPRELPLAPTNPAPRPRSSGGFVSPRLELVAGSGRFKALLLEQAAAKEGVKQEQCREGVAARLYLLSPQIKPIPVRCALTPIFCSLLRLKKATSLATRRQERGGGRRTRYHRGSSKPEKHPSETRRSLKIRSLFIRIQ